VITKNNLYPASMQQDLLILTSPPASGKTFWIESFIQELNHSSLLVISPLRALADECRLRWKDRVKVVTPEEWLMNKSFYEIVIIDEFHLWFYWGDSFRPLLWEMFYEVTAESILTIMLTATLNQQMQMELRSFIFHFNQIHWLDFGNQQLKYLPFCYIKGPSATWISALILARGARKGVVLIFCPYRKEVVSWKAQLEEEGYTVWSCVGGEAAAFSEQVSTQKPPDFIVATSVLSHGVNLPHISDIYFTYALKNRDFWIQMVARGGRRGELFRVFALDNPHGIKWNRWTNSFALFKFSVIIKKDQLQRQVSQWFLKD
jgi:ATP-dependent DNA helicase RecQ